MIARARIASLLGVVLLALALVGCAGRGNEGAKGDETGAEGTGAESLGGGITWRREGGIAGFCDIVTLSADGSATVSTCRADPSETLAAPELTATQASLVADWVERFRSFERKQTDPASADAMTIVIVFDGEGTAEPAENDLAAMSALAQEVLIQSLP